MNLTDQTVTGQNEITIQNALSASLFRLNLKMKSNTVAPNTNDLIVYVDKATSSNPTSERKQYVFNLHDILRYYNGVGDELLQEVNVVENDSLLISKVIRKISSDGTSELLEPVEEELDIADIVLFDGTNYIYTNYLNIEITAIYLKDTDENKMYLSSGIFNGQRDKRALTKDDIYFKDAFTKDQDKLNLEVDNACVECITSKNNRFSLDANGNLVVNSITANSSSGTMDREAVVNLIYPVGSIYLSVNNTSPATLFGGSWQSISGYYLYAGTGGNTAGSNTSGGPSTNTSGGPSNNTSGSTTLTTNQIPSHTHTMSEGGAHKHQYQGYWTVPSQASSYHCISRNKVNGDPLETPGSMVSNSGAHTHTLNNTGGGQGHTHTLSSHTHTLGNHTHSVTPLRYEVYMWKRTA